MDTGFEKKILLQEIQVRDQNQFEKAANKKKKKTKNRISRANEKKSNKNP